MKLPSNISSPRVISTIVIYLFINLLFVIKYSPRANFNPAICAAIYLLFTVLAAGTVYALIKTYYKTEIWKYLYWTTAGLCVLVFIAALHHIDASIVNVDRWSALHNFLLSMLNGEYPYASRTHLGNAASPLPFMQLIALPFFLLGDVGYIQIFVFAAAVVIAAKNGPWPAHPVLFILFLLLSPAFIWELLVRSDFSSNMIIACITFFLIYKYSKKQKSHISMIEGIICGLLLMTRVILIVPVILFYTRHFIASDWKHRFTFIAGAFLAGTAMLLPFYIWNPKLFFTCNPLLLQGSKTPAAFMAVLFLCTFVLSLRIRNASEAFLNTGILFFLLMLSTFLFKTLQYGFGAVLYENMFDISYFTSALPFLLFSLIPIRSDCVREKTI
jgi:hypothetical protein